MSKSIKFKNNTFLDSSSVIHKRKILKEILDNYVGGATGDTLPIGSIIEWGSNTIPNNWLLCNGQEISRTQYSELFEILGTTWGEGDGTTTFNLPDKQGLVSVGAGTHTDKNKKKNTFELGKEYGEYEHTQTLDELVNHGHRFSSWAYAYQTGGTRFCADRDTDVDNFDDTDTHIQTTGGGKPMNIIQPSIAMNYIIKAYQSAGVVAEVIQENGQTSDTNVYSAKAVEELLKKFEPETITNENGTAIKFSDGTMICTKTITGTCTTTSWGAIFYCDIDFTSWAIPFKTIQSVQANSHDTVYWCTAFYNITGAQVRLFRPTQTTETYNVCLTAIGRWK